MMSHPARGVVEGGEGIHPHALERSEPRLQEPIARMRMLGCIEAHQHAKAKKATGMSWSARREAERAPAAAAEVFVHTKPWRTLTELKREAMAQRPWKGAKLRGAAAVAAAEAEAKT